MEWSVLVPVKRLAAAKTRLRGAVGAERHESLVLAMAQDTVAAALATVGVGGVVVVTADPTVTAAVTALGARAVPEPALGGLNAALAHAASTVVGRIAALPADLPALRGDHLSAALRALATAAGGGYVPDAAGTGTVLLAAAAGERLIPRFGPGSAAAHGHGGARRLEGDWPSLRHDVDTAADLAVAVALGAGPHTRAVLRADVAVPHR
ncbi:2-phospho-L-lactate guanylyltransferase [Virgisporangium ochraceum]|uniref:Phosphoenolpyruvate guanylyltransferase n=1 Tax=Virgisporangium ochraceum TaxID=65505 RepID=A0A8J3ZW85_9ACTN|nr:2-phospho-L-lactate guanylyltransferase [Virgisporangium ochraceum]GIJ69293.1 2-phospho-L-lactate guanylyltransferase [Virgisporangium ochraceum]